MPQADAVSALILAGGRSRRFGTDKTVAVWRGRPLLDHVIQLAKSVSDDVIVLSAWARHVPEPDANDGVRVLADPEPFPGPLVAATTGLVHVRHGLCIILAADMPAVGVDVLANMLAEATRDASRCAVALARDGEPQPLPLVIRPRAAYPYLARVVASGERRLRAALDMPGTFVIGKPASRAGGAASTLLDVDTQQDLATLVRATPAA